ncbi:MAG TPA: pseudouridine synthase [Anaerolineales bacterium]|nr:pseudouridine synthase [Anaerolineales bacterium]
MAKIILFNKPYLVLTQFTDPQGRTTLADYLPMPELVTAGRLDYDSEGLLVLTDDGRMVQRIIQPRYKMPKTYWVQVEGLPTPAALRQLEQGIQLNDGMTLPAKARLLESPPTLWERTPPIRFRKSIPDTWIELTIREGRNRQVRRMTAAVGYPTLRLVRVQVGQWKLEGLKPGEWRELQVN